MKIKVSNLTHIYSIGGPFEKKAVDNVSFEINQGEFVGLIGHTGSGKSTLIQHLNGLIKPSSGNVFLDDTDVFHKETDLARVRQKVGLVFQYPEYQLFEETVKKDIEFGIKNLKLSAEEVHRRVEKTMELVGLDKSLMEASPFDLSGGQKRRVAIAGVLVMEPEVLIMDEPAAGLDPAGRENIFSLINKLHKEKNITIVLVSHSMEDIAKLADRIIVMENGKILMDDCPSKVFSREEELEKVGLTVPAVSKILNGIRADGYNIKENIFDTEEAAQEILKILKEKKC